MAERVPGAAMRRRQRLLRAFHRHVQWQVKLELATGLHHSAQRPRPVVEEPKEGVEGETFHAPRRQKPSPPGMRPASLAEPRGVVERVQPHTVDQMVDAPLLPTFDVPVPLMVEQLLLGVLSPLDFRVAEQVIEVPKILLDDVPERTAVRVTQLAEQLVEVPTLVSCMEQIADIPVPGRGVSGSLQGSLPEQSTVKRTASQTADIPVPGRGVSGSLLGSLPVQSTAKRTASQFGFLPEQKTTALHVSQERISERIEQIGAGGDFPSRRAGPRVVLPRQGSAAAGAEQIADLASSGENTASPGAENADMHLPESAEWVQSRDDKGRTYYWNRRTRATRWKPPPGIRVVWVGEKFSGGRSGTGTRVPVPVHMTSLLCLLSEAHRGEGLGIPSPHLGCHFWRLFGVVMLPEEFFGSGLFWEVSSLISVSCTSLALQWIHYMRQSSVLLVAISHISV